MMELGIIPDKFIYINVPETDVLVERCLGRRLDPVTGEIYHKKFKPPPDDPEIASRLEHRDDDREEAVARRLELFNEGIEDVLEIFNDIKLELDGTGPLKEVLKAAHLYVYQFAAQHAMGTLDTLVQVLFLQHDKGDQAADPLWAAGDEPTPAAVDTWGRGVVPLKRRFKPLTVEELQQGGEWSRPTSVHSRTSKASAATGGLGGAKKKEEKKVKNEEKKKEDKKVPEEMSTEDKLRAFLKAKNDEAQAKNKKAKEYAENVQKMERQIKSFTSRGQNFTMDYQGEVIMVNEIPGDKIPGPNVAVKSALAQGPKPPQDPKFSAAAGGGGAPNKKFFTPSDTVQPPAVESHVLATGVVLKEGGQQREGPARARDSLHMTRKEYTAIIEAVNPTLGASMHMSQERVGFFWVRFNTHQCSYVTRADRRVKTKGFMTTKSLKDWLRRDGCMGGYHVLN
jgi:hypothetical protein